MMINLKKLQEFIVNLPNTFKMFYTSVIFLLKPNKNNREMLIKRLLPTHDTFSMVLMEGGILLKFII